tara:strand:- start:7427 stop:7537 length:111 start_codon:yes stop_codon:yes gene_type:complete
MNFSPYFYSINHDFLDQAILGQVYGLKPLNLSGRVA